MRALLFVQWLAFAEPRVTDPAARDHVVVAGESLWGIGRARGCTLTELRAANPELREPLRVGTRLKVPRCAGDRRDASTPIRPASAAAPERTSKTRRPTDTKSRIPVEPPQVARVRAKAAAKAAAASGARTADEGTTPTRSRDAEGTAEHRVAGGETLSSIARRYHTSVAELQRANGLRSTTIVVGQRLRIAVVERKLEDDADLRKLPPPPARGRDEDDRDHDARDDDDRDARDDDDDDRDARDEDDRDRDAHDDDRDATSDKAADALRTARDAAGSVGRSSGSRLVGAVQLPADRAYYLRHPKRAWGAPHVVGSTRAAIAAVKRKHPGVHRLAIGDISAQRGGKLSGHRSHQTGRDVDLGLYFERVPRSYPKRFVAADAGELDLAATWALVDEFYRQSQRPGGPVAIFLDFAVQGRLYHWARKHGVARRVLLEVFQYPHGRWARKGLVRHEPAHDDHLHVRFGCPPRDRTCR